MKTKRITFRAPEDWDGKLDKLAEKQNLPDRSALIRKDLADKYSELTKAPTRGN